MSAFILKNFGHKNDNDDDTEIQRIDEMKYSLMKAVGYVQMLFLLLQVFYSGHFVALKYSDLWK